MNIVRRTLLSKHYSLATVKVYSYWIRYFIRQQKLSSPSEASAESVTEFLSFLAVEKHVSPNTQRQAFSALLFLFRHVLHRKLEGVDAIRAKDSQRIPVVLNTQEVEAVLQNLPEPYRLMVELAWGAGLRKSEVLRLRIKDLDFSRKTLIVRQGKGRKDRVTILPERCVARLEENIATGGNAVISPADRGGSISEARAPYQTALKELSIAA